MPCCGQKRAALNKLTRDIRLQTVPTARVEALVPSRNKPSSMTVNELIIPYLGSSSPSLRGPSSGRAYYFAEAGANLNVDEKDVDAILRTQLFRRAQV